MQDISKLISGFRVFRATYFDHRPELFEKLSRSGQRPKTLIIACSDSRVDPAILFNSEPGELFVVRNVANLVPPYQPDEHYHGTSAALEFAVRDLQVTNVIVLGHSHCGGIRALCEAAQGRSADREFIGPWISIAEHVCCAEHGYREDIGDGNGSHRMVEQAAIKESIANLRTFPWLLEKEKAGGLALHGWWFDLEQGALWQLDQEQGQFVTIEPLPAIP